MMESGTWSGPACTVYRPMLVVVASLAVSTLLWSQRICPSQSFVEVSKARTFVDDDAVLEIPVVFHLIMANAQQEVSFERLDRQLDALNRDFSRTNLDRHLTPARFQSVAADCRLSFCRATVDPSGQPTQGVSRTQTDVPEIGLTDRFDRRSRGGADAWDAHRYLNIWICEIESGGAIGGIAFVNPGSVDKTDGVVIDYRYVWSDDTLYAPFHLGRTLTHEIGHWLGLKHIWGDQPGCQHDDGIDDTPLQLDSYRGCPEGDQGTCGSPDMYMNFMDLTHDACMNVFTEGQKNSMRQMLLNFRQGLLSDAPTCTLSTAVSQFGQTHWSVYPNPATDRIDVEVSAQASIGRIRITDLAGRMVAESRHAGSIDVSDLLAGVYILSVHTVKGVLSEKILIAR